MDCNYYCTALGKAVFHRFIILVFFNSVDDKNKGADEGRKSTSSQNPSAWVNEVHDEEANDRCNNFRCTTRQIVQCHHRTLVLESLWIAPDHCTTANKVRISKLLQHRSRINYYWPAQGRERLTPHATPNSASADTAKTSESRCTTTMVRAIHMAWVNCKT